MGFSTSADVEWSSGRESLTGDFVLLATRSVVGFQDSAKVEVSLVFNF